MTSSTDSFGQSAALACGVERESYDRGRNGPGEAARGEGCACLHHCLARDAVRSERWVGGGSLCVFTHVMLFRYLPAQVDQDGYVETEGKKKLDFTRPRGQNYIRETLAADWCVTDLCTM